MNDTSVLVVGGSLVGLSTAMFLAARGVRTIVVERHAGSSLHPRAIGFTPRTLELFRQVGIDSRVPQAPADFRLRRARVATLDGPILGETPWTAGDGPNPVDFSPMTGAAIAQDRLEPILRQRASELGADIRMGTELVAFTQDADGVTAELRTRAGVTSTIRADYLVAADGHASPVREALGVARSGRGHIRTVRSVLFEAPLEQYLAGGVSQFSIERPDLRAFLTTYGDGRWVLMFTDDVERDPTTLRALIVKAVGHEVPITLVTTGRWELSALIADTFQVGRVFLAGDAAHTLPPSRGGFGANTGIEDAHNLAWKIAAVLAGTSDPALLATYDAERRPIAWLRHAQIFAREDYQREGAGVSRGVAILDDAAMELGQLYRSAAILGAGAELPPAAAPDVWRGQPGTRAPHVVFADGTSTLDRFGDGWVLVTSDARWSAMDGLTLVRVVPEVAARFGLITGAALVRPDGYIAWRGDDPAALAPAFAQVQSSTTTSL